MRKAYRPIYYIGRFTLCEVQVGRLPEATPMIPRCVSPSGSPRSIGQPELDKVLSWRKNRGMTGMEEGMYGFEIILTCILPGR